MTSTTPYMPGALVAGWSAFVVDVVLSRYAGRYEAAMSTEQRAELAATRRQVHAAALLWRDASAVGSAEAVAAETAPASDLMTTTEAATLLGITERRVRQLAVAWEPQGAAVKAGRLWLLDRQACRLHAETRRTA